MNEYEEEIPMKGDIDLTHFAKMHSEKSEMLIKAIEILIRIADKQKLAEIIAKEWKED